MMITHLLWSLIFLTVDFEIAGFQPPLKIPAQVFSGEFRET